MTNLNKLKIALVYDRVIKFGGAERILLALHELWPEAPLYTAFYDREAADWARDFKIKVSFFNNIPLFIKSQEFFPLLTPYAFESFNFDGFDLVLSVTSADAKSIITKPGTLHICYCLTPTRYLWSASDDYYRQPGAGIFNPLIRAGMKFYLPQLRHWDFLSSKRPDYYLAISREVQTRIGKYYKEKSRLVYPPCDTAVFKLAAKQASSNYFLIVSRLVPYKKIDYIIAAFNENGFPLKIIGSGIDEKRLKEKALGNIEFIDGNLTDQKLAWYYQNCRALIFPGIEDFGLTAVEAQACGKPVLALGEGGVKESIADNISGQFYREPTSTNFNDSLKIFMKKDFDPEKCRSNALKFSKVKFREKLLNTVERIVSEAGTNL